MKITQDLSRIPSVFGKRNGKRGGHVQRKQPSIRTQGTRSNFVTVCSLKLPLVIPVLFCTGQRSPIRWPDKFDDPALAGKLYSDASPLIDVTVIPDDEIAGHRSIAALTLLQKYIHQQDLAELFDRLAPILLAGYLSSSLVLYVVQAGETSGAQAFVRELTQRVPQHGYALMFIAQQLEQKGIEKGIQLGGNGLRIMYRKVLVHIVIRDCRQ